MFYQLTRYEGRALPTTCQLDQRTITVASGGLLLEPGGAGVPGYAILQLFRPPGSRPSFLLMSSESYRWNAGGELEIFRDVPEDACFRGTAGEGCLFLTADEGVQSLAAGTTLTFRAAPDTPVTAEWATLFDYEPPTARSVDIAQMNDEQVRRVIREQIEEDEASRVQEASDRLERAWRAAVSPKPST